MPAAADISGQAAAAAAAFTRYVYSYGTAGAAGKVIVIYETQGTPFTPPPAAAGSAWRVDSAAASQNAQVGWSYTAGVYGAPS